MRISRNYYSKLDFLKKILPNHITVCKIVSRLLKNMVNINFINRNFKVFFKKIDIIQILNSNWKMLCYACAEFF